LVAVAVVLAAILVMVDQEQALQQIQHQALVALVVVAVKVQAVVA
jgi:hypothetical protein